jgi:hypothetical protein
LDKVLEKKAKEPGWEISGRELEVVDCVKWLIEKDGLDN